MSDLLAYPQNRKIMTSKHRKTFVFYPPFSYVTIDKIYIQKVT